jgi:hypothetical protein
VFSDVRYYIQCIYIYKNISTQAVLAAKEGITGMTVQLSAPINTHTQRRKHVRRKTLLAFQLINWTLLFKALVMYWTYTAEGQITLIGAYAGG